MAIPLIFSSIAAGLLATAVMVFFYYLPQAWGGDYYDVLGALGSARSGELDDGAFFSGAVLYFLGGIVFAVLYGLIALAMIGAGMIEVPQLVIFEGLLPVDINLFYPLIGMVFGLGHGVIVSLLLQIVVIEHHPIERFRTRYIMIVSQLIGHVAFGATVMFFHSQFLPLLGVPG